ncbi:hypothetical protein ABXZ88_004622 [Vibrio fluvialis]
MSKQYPLSIQNVGGHTYMLLSKGHHDIHDFMKAVRVAGYDWPLGVPEHVWFKAAPNKEEGGSSYHRCNAKTIGAFPATFVSEAYGDDKYPNMIMWTGTNLKDVIAFTGKSPRFDEWFSSWESFEDHVKREGNTIKLIKSTGNEVARVGDWLYRDQEGQKHVLSSVR